MPTTLPTTDEPRPARAWTALRTWSARRWWVAAGTGVLTMLLVALPTAVIPNPIFGRAIETTWWSYPVVILTGILGGLLIATYVKEPAPFAQDAESGEQADRPLTLGAVGGLVSFFAVGCPVCNKLVLIALGTSGAMSWFAPLQPILAVASIVLMGWALRARLRGEISCSLPAAR
jgi:hypothetical protein